MLREKKWAKLTLLLVGLLLLGVGISHAEQGHSKDFRKNGENAILAGGGIGEDDVEIFTEIAERAGGMDGNICIVVASSYPWTWDYEVCLDQGHTGQAAIDCADDYGWQYGNSKINIEYYGQILLDTGMIDQYTGIYVDPTIREENSNPLLVEAANSCTGFFFTGGDQSRGIYALRDDRGKASPVLKAIQRKIKKGALMAGTSAGTAIQTKKYVMANGFNPVALTNGAAPAVWDIDESELVFEGGVCDGCDELLYNRFKGVGNFKYGITDTHFSDRERALRLLRLLADTRRSFGFGIDTATSLNVENGIMTVMGLDGVTILDLRRARVDRNSDSFNIENVRISYIREGDTYNGRRKYFSLGGDPIVESETEALVNDDIMDEGDSGGFQMVSLLAELAQSTQEIATGYSLSTDPGYKVTLQKDRRTRAAMNNGNVSIVNVKMAVETLE